MILIRHREELHLRAVVIPTWVYAILWRSSFVYTSALIRRSPNSAPHGTHDYQSHSARHYKQRKTPTSEHSCVITLRTLILAPPRGDDIYISFSYYFCMIFFNPHWTLRLSHYLPTSLVNYLLQLSIFSPQKHKTPQGSTRRTAYGALLIIEAVSLSSPSKCLFTQSKLRCLWLRQPKTTSFYSTSQQKKQG